MARAKVISQIVAGSQPSLSVTDRADGGGYTVTAGARSLSITAEAGATLLTTVTDQDNASITVTDSTSTTPSWTAPGGGTTGADYCVQVTATLGGYTSQVSFSELVDGSGGGGGGTSYTDSLTDDWTGEASQDLTSGGDGAKTLGGRTWTATGTANANTWGPDGSTGVVFDAGAGGALRLATQIDNLAGVQADSLLWVWTAWSVTSYGANGAYCGVQWNDTNNGPGTQGGQAIFRRSSASDFRWRLTPRSGSSWGSNSDSGAAVVASAPTSVRIAVLIDQGQALVYGDVNGGTGAPSPGGMAYLGYVDFGGAVANLTAARRFGMYMHPIVGASSNMTLVNSGVKRVEG